jgi:hypothetical protein
MSGLLFLTTEDFNTQNGVKGPIMCTNIQGFSVILFYSTECQHCQSLIPIFKRKIMNFIFQTVTQKELSENAGTEI